MTAITGVRQGVGESVRRPDGIPKVKGEFAYSSDLWADGMLWGATLRSPHPRARVAGIELAAALAVPGVHAVLTHHDVPGRKVYGLEHHDQPVLAFGEVRYQGEPVAIVAADHPETARRAADRIEVAYEVLEPLTDPQRALDPETPPLHPRGNVLRHVHIAHGDEPGEADVVVTGEYEVGMQDQAFLGPESGLAVPAEDGGVDLFISTQWLHVDRDQVAASLDLPPEKVRFTLAGVGGAFGGREDVSMQIHASLLALHTGRPVKMVYGREESFFGHVHRHPARLRYEHGAARDGRLAYVKAWILLDGGAYASSSSAVCSNAAAFAVGPYAVPSARIDSYVVYTDNPPCGAMRGFGAVQSCFAHEAQMDKLAAALGLDPVELRLRNAMTTGTTLPTGAPINCPAPVAELLERVRDRTLPAAGGPVPGGVGNVTHGEGVVRVTFAFAAHRAVVDVDTELGLVRVVEIATAQDVGKAMNPLAVEGQIEGGIAQGLGLALMEEIVVVDGAVRNASFTDYLIPTVLDMPPVRLDILELGDPDSPYGLRGIGEPPTISSTPAIVAALRAATGAALSRVPVRPDDMVGL